MAVRLAAYSSMATRGLRANGRQAASLKPNSMMVKPASISSRFMRSMPMAVVSPPTPLLQTAQASGRHSSSSHCDTRSNARSQAAHRQRSRIPQAMDRQRHGGTVQCLVGINSAFVVGTECILSAVGSG